MGHFKNSELVSKSLGIKGEVGNIKKSMCLEFAPSFLFLFICWMFPLKSFRKRRRKKKTELDIWAGWYVSLSYQTAALKVLKHLLSLRSYGDLNLVSRSVSRFAGPIFLFPSRVFRAGLKSWVKIRMKVHVSPFSKPVSNYASFFSLLQLAIHPKSC